MISFLLLPLALYPFLVQQAHQSAVVKSEFIFTTAPFPSCHASTIAETDQGLIAAWFGGTSEGSPDVAIWSSRYLDSAWTKPVRLADGKQADGKLYPCWNPVLFRPTGGPLMLFYKVGPNPRAWWGMFKTSNDGGRTWSGAHQLPTGVLGPIKNKPVQLPNGDLLCGSSTEGESPNLWRIHFERTSDRGKTWQLIRSPMSVGQAEIDAIQPSILVHPNDSLEAVGRTRSGRLFETWSTDGGETWTPLTLTDIPNPNSGTDAVTLRDGRFVLVYNRSTTLRTPLNVAISDDGKWWKPALVLESEPGEYSYPAVIQTGDGLIHITYTWKRERIKHVVVDPSRLVLRSIPNLR